MDAQNGATALATDPCLTADRRLDLQLDDAFVDGERQFRPLVEGGDDCAIYILNPHGIVISWNSGAQRIESYIADDILGRSFACFYSENDQKAGIPSHDLAIARKESRFHAEGWRVRKNRGRFWAEVLIDNIFGAEGQSLGFAMIVRDITEMRSAQLALHRSERKLKAFAEMSSDWFWEQDADLRFVRDSNIPQTSLPTDVGKTRWELGDPAMEQSRWDSHKADLLARRSFRNFRWERIGFEGKRRYMSTSGDPIFDETGSFLGYHGTGRDITPEVEKAEEFRAAKKLAEDVSRAKTLFLANISHELRTPLHAIIGFGELINNLASDRLEAYQTGWAAEIISSGRQLLHVLNSVLELSRIESGSYEFLERRVDLAVAVRSCLKIIGPQAKAGGVQLTYSTAEETGLLLADPRAIRQIVRNVLSNAVKFTPAVGTVSIRIERTANHELELIVADSGIGIDPLLLASLCDPFAQRGTALNWAYKGAGLGLAISSKLMALHDGKLMVESRLGIGTTVVVSFPEARVIPDRSLRTDVSETSACSADQSVCEGVGRLIGAGDWMIL